MYHYCMKKWDLSCHFHSQLIFPTLDDQRASGDPSRMPFLQARRPVFILVACPAPWWTDEVFSVLFSQAYIFKKLVSGLVRTRGYLNLYPITVSCQHPKENMFHCTLQTFSLQQFDEQGFYWPRGDECHGFSGSFVQLPFELPKVLR